MDRGDWQEVFGYALMFIGTVLVWLRFDWLIALIVFTLILGTCIVLCGCIRFLAHHMANQIESHEKN